VALSASAARLLEHHAAPVGLAALKSPRERPRGAAQRPAKGARPRHARVARRLRQHRATRQARRTGWPSRARRPALEPRVMSDSLGTALGQPRRNPTSPRGSRLAPAVVTHDVSNTTANTARPAASTTSLPSMTRTACPSRRTFIDPSVSSGRAWVASRPAQNGGCRAAPRPTQASCNSERSVQLTPRAAPSPNQQALETPAPPAEDESSSECRRPSPRCHSSDEALAWPDADGQQQPGEAFFVYRGTSASGALFTTRPGGASTNGATGCTSEQRITGDAHGRRHHRRPHAADPRDDRPRLHRTCVPRRHRHRHHRRHPRTDAARERRSP